MNNTLITQDRLDSIEKLSKITTKGKYVAEVGVYKGGSLKWLCELFPESVVVGFDTFEGLPKEKWNKKEVHKPGDFSDTSLDAVYQFMKDVKSEWCLVKGLFPDTTIPHWVDQQYSFVHVDTDFYQTILDAIDFFLPRLIEGGIMVFDDYDWTNCPGVKKALEERFDKKEIAQLTKYQAYIIK